VPLKTATAAALLLVATLQPAAAASCLTPKEQRATLVRQLQTELMVAALTCARDPGSDLSGRYKAFVERFGDELIANADVLRGYFARAYGKAQNRRFDSFITALANEASRRAMGVQGYCRDAAPRFEAVLGVGGDGLERFAAETVTPSQRLEACARP